MTLDEALAELNSVRREVGADKQCVHCGQGEHGSLHEVLDGRPRTLHTYEPESTLAAVQRMARERTYLKQLYDAEFYNRDTVGQMYQKLAMALHCIAAGAGSTPDGERAIAALQAAEKLKMDRVAGAPKVGQARGTAKPEEG